MKRAMVDLLNGRILFDCGGLYLFKLFYKKEYNKPSFKDTRWRQQGKVNDDIPF